MLYNTDISLWENYLAKNPKTVLRVYFGQIWSPDDGAIGQFDNSIDACNALKSAGYPDNLIDLAEKYHFEVFSLEDGSRKWVAPFKDEKTLLDAVLDYSARGFVVKVTKFN